MEESKNANVEETQDVETQEQETQGFDINTVLEHPEFQKFGLSTPFDTIFIRSF